MPSQAYWTCGLFHLAPAAQSFGSPQRMGTKQRHPVSQHRQLRLCSATSHVPRQPHMGPRVSRRSSALTCRPRLILASVIAVAGAPSFTAPTHEPAKIASTKRAFLILAALCVSTIGFSLSPASASAALTYVSAGTIPVASFTPSHSSSLYAESVAVDDHNGHIYVADSNSGEILDYSSASDTSPELWTGFNTPAGSFGGGKVSVAVDNSTGDVYVANPNGRVIDKFDQNGNLITSFGDTLNGGKPEP